MMMMIVMIVMIVVVLVGTQSSPCQKPPDLRLVNFNGLLQHCFSFKPYRYVLISPHRLSLCLLIGFGHVRSVIHSLMFVFGCNAHWNGVFGMGEGRRRRRRERETVGSLQVCASKPEQFSTFPLDIRLTRVRKHVWVVGSGRE